MRLDPKRRSGASGVDSWYPYYAGYSTSFARAILTTLHEGVTVLDPWNGSGTTTYVAHRHGLNAVGFDLNPFSCLVASAKLVTPDQVAGVTALAEAAARRVPSRNGGWGPDDPLDRWLPDQAAATFRDAAMSILSNAHPYVGLPLDACLPSEVALVLLCLIRAVRELALPKRRSNPTWVTPGSKIDPISRRALLGRFLQIVTAVSGDIEGTRQQYRPTRLEVANSRALPLSDESIDFVLTSPPYCTRIDYAVTTAFELACLGLDGSGAFRNLRESMMGTTVIRPAGCPAGPAVWPRSVARLLDAVRAHPSYASSGYYHKNLWQYFDDACRSIQEIARVLRPTGVALLVLQTSYYKEIQIDLPSLYVDIGNSCGLTSEVLRACDIPVSRVMASLNPLARKHLRDRSYTESVILLEKP